MILPSQLCLGMEQWLGRGAVQGGAGGWPRGLGFPVRGRHCTTEAGQGLRMAAVGVGPPESLPVSGIRSLGAVAGAEEGLPQPGTATRGL